MLCHTLKEANDVLLLDEAHLAVNLGELGLAVGTQVLVSEALNNLEIAVHARYHKQLLECLRRLRQGIELAGVHAGGHHKVASALGCGANEHRRLNFEEAFAVEVAAHLHGHAMAQLEVAADCSAAQIEITIAHAQVIAAIGVVFDGEGRHLTGVEHTQLVSYNLDIAGGDMVVFR